MDLLLYVVFAGVYILTINLAVAWKDQFNLFLMVGIFVLGGAIGAFMQSYEVGFVISVILSLVLW